MLKRPQSGDVPAHVKKKSMSSGSTDGIELQGMEQGGDGADPAPGDESDGSVKTSSDYDKFKCIMNYMYLRKSRNMQYSKGVYSALAVSIISNLMLVFLCMFSWKMGEISNIPERRFQPLVTREGIPLGYEMFEFIPTVKPLIDPVTFEPAGIANVTVFFSPCQQVADDPLQEFLDSYKSKPLMSKWDLKCYSSAAEMASAFNSDTSGGAMAGYHITSPTANLFEPDKSVTYELQFSQTLNNLNKEIFGTDHNEDLTVSIFLSNFLVGFQTIFEEAVAAAKVRASTSAPSSAPSMAPPGGSSGSSSSTSSDGDVLPLLFDIRLERGPTTSYETYDDTDSQFGFIPIYLIMLIANIVTEQLVTILSDKEANFKESLQLAGEPTWAYFASWFIWTVWGLLPYTFLTSLLLGVSCFSSSSFGIVLLFFVLSTFPLAALAVALSSLFGSVTYGSMMGSVIIYAFSGFGALLKSEDLPLIVKDIIMLLPSCTVSYGITAFTDAEMLVNVGRGITWDNISDQLNENSVPFYHTFIFLILGTFVFLGLAWYLDKVVPDKWGKKLSLGFCFSYDYWFEEHLTVMQAMQMSAVRKNLAAASPTGNKKNLVPGIECQQLRKVYGAQDKEMQGEVEKRFVFTGRLASLEFLSSESTVRFRMHMKDLVDSSIFSGLIYLVVGGNLVAMIFDKDTNTEEFADFLYKVNIMFLVVYILEMILKWIGLSVKHYFYDPFNCFDFVLVIFGLVEIAILGTTSGVAGNLKATKGIKSVRMLKALRVFRVARILKFFFDDDDPASKRVVALDNLNLTAYRGEILSLLGQNGAGKTTFFSMLGGITLPTTGKVMVEGVNIIQSLEMLKVFVGLCPQHDILFDYLSVEDHLRMFAVMKGIHPSTLDREIDKTLDSVGLTSKRADFVNNLSGGMRRRTSIAMACLGDPRVILLDEPSAGVDIVNRQIVWKQLVELKKGRTLIMSTHFMEEAEILGDRVAVLKKGKMQVNGTCQELHTQFGAGYTLVIQRPINPDLMTVTQSMQALSFSQKVFVKKASDIMEQEEATKLSDAVVEAYESHLKEGSPRLLAKLATAAKEVKNAEHREVLSGKCVPEKILKFLEKHIPGVELLSFTEEQTNFEFVLPFNSRGRLSGMFLDIEKNKGDFGFENFGVSAPTLQEIFLEISDIDEEAGESVSQLINQEENLDGKSAAAQAVERRASGVAIRHAERRGSSRRDSRRNSVDNQFNEKRARRRSSISQGISGSAVQDGGKKEPEAKLEKEVDTVADDKKREEDDDADTKKAGDSDDDDEGIGELPAIGKKLPQMGRKRSSLGNARRSSTMRRGSGIILNLGKMMGNANKEETGEGAAQKKKVEHSSTQKYRKKKTIEWSMGVPRVNMYTQTKAMMVKRYYMSKRNKKAMFLEGVMPVLGVLMGVIFFKMSHSTIEREHEGVQIAPSMYKNHDLRWLFNSDELTNPSRPEHPLEKWGPELLSVGCSKSSDTCPIFYEVTQTRWSSKYMDFLNSGINCERFDDYYDSSCAAFDSNDPVMGEVNADIFDSSDPASNKMKIIYNGTNHWGVPLMVNIVSQSMLAERLNMNGEDVALADRSIGVTYKAFPKTEEEYNKANIPSGIEVGTAMVIFMTFASITASQCTNAVAERENGCKRQQLISGVHPLSFWFANFLFDFSFFLIVPYTAVCLLVAGFEVHPYTNHTGELATLLLFWGLAGVPFSYACSFSFAKSSSAQIMMVTLNTVFSLIVIFVILFLENEDLTAIATPFRFLGMMVPHVSLGLSFWTFINEGTLNTDDGTLAGDGMLPLYILLFEFFIFFTLVVAMENTQDAAQKGYAKSKEGTMDEEEADRCKPKSQNAAGMRKISESDLFMNLINFMIILNLLAIFVELGTDESGVLSAEQASFLESVQLFFNLLFICEFAIKIGGYGPIGYLKDPFNIFDALLVVVSFADIALMGSSDIGMVKLLKLFKVLRMMRMLRLLRFVKMAKYSDGKKQTNTMLSREQEEIANRKSTGRRDSLVQRLSILGGDSVEGSAVYKERERITRRLSNRAEERKRSRGRLSLDETNQKKHSISGGFEDMVVEEELLTDEENLNSIAAGEKNDAVAIDNLIKVFTPPGREQIVATNDVGFGVRQGEIFSLLGPNGAGKSTLLNMMTGSIAPTSGEIYVLDHNISTQFDQIKSRIGFCPQYDALVSLMNSYETLKMFARIKGIPEEDIDPLVDSIIKCIGLARHADKMSCTYSGGNKRKLSVAIALIANPDLIFLDEPSTGMDPSSLTDVYSCVWMWIRSGENRSIVLTTHSMEEADSLSNRIGILVNGKLAILGSAQELKSSFGSTYSFEGSIEAGEDMADRAQMMVDLLKKLCPECTDDGSFDGIVRYNLPVDNFKLSEIFSVLEEHRGKLRIKDYTVSQTSLEHVFIHFAQHQR